MIWTEERLDIWQGDGGGLVNDDQIGVADFVSVGGVHVLDELCVGFLDLETNYGLVVVFRRTVYLLIVHAVFIVESLEAQAYELEEGFEVVRGWSGDKDVAEA